MRQTFELEHFYGDYVHILDDPLANTLLSKTCSPETTQPTINRLVATLYRQMVCNVISREMQTREVAMLTRMAEKHPQAVWRGRIIDPQLKVVVVCVARAGIFPSQVSYDFLNELVDPQVVRQDHMLMGRSTDASGAVSGAAIQGAKIGGSVENATLFIPDPMGATGSTVKTLLEHYDKKVAGTPRRVIALNLIVTPEYIRNLKEAEQDITIYAYRVDRGLSPQDVLAATPGEYWDQERGLDENGYIVPGGGGFGEIMNNAFV
jgi:uracil phosphoribosyltransferase